MSNRLNDIANELNERAHELAKTNPSLEAVAQSLHNAAAAIRLADKADEESGTGAYRISFLLWGAEVAVRNVVRRMLDDAGMGEVAFKMPPATRGQLEELYQELVGRKIRDP